MSLLMEALLVGLYTTFIGYCVQIFMNTTTSAYFYLFIVGFFKHFMGYFLYIHDYYCNVCNKKNMNMNMKNNHFFTHVYISNSSLLELIIESCVEGIIFIILGLFVISVGVLMLNNNNNKNKWIFLFLFGFLLHYISDVFGIHELFCKYRCVKSNNLDLFFNQPEEFKRSQCA